MCMGILLACVPVHHVLGFKEICELMMSRVASPLANAKHFTKTKDI